MKMLKMNYYEMASVQSVDAKKVIDSIEEDELFPGRKRRRLDNLNVDERILRRKLKNRVAAQTARDRKKAHMEDLETTIARMEKENKFLKKNNQELRSKVHNLNETNLQLRIRLGLTPPQSPSQIYTCSTTKSLKNDCHIITPSVSDHDHIVIKKEELSSEYAEESSSDNACFVSHDVRQESQPELLLDVVGDEEPRYATESSFECKVSSGITTIEKENTQHNSQVVPSLHVKQEEFDVDEFFADPSNDTTCPSSPGSQPSSPDSGTDCETENLIKFCIDSEKSLVGLDAADGCTESVSTDLFVDEEFFISDEMNAACDVLDMGTNDPFSELFPSLLSV